MRIENNSTNFKSVTISKQALNEMSNRMPAGQFVCKLEKFKDMYKDSPVKMIIGTCDKENPRLDAIIQCEKNVVYIMENIISYFLDLNPFAFLNKAGKELEKMEKNMDIVR